MVIAAPKCDAADCTELHMFPLAYKRHNVIRNNSPKLLAFEGAAVDAETANATFDRFMIKDYAKSVKGTSFPSCIRTPVGQDEMNLLASEFVKLRGNLFAKGITLRQFVNLRRCGDATNEWRAVHLKNSTLCVYGNSEQPPTAPDPPEELTKHCEELGNPYYTVDLAELDDGSLKIVETGDGQISGLASSQSPTDYYRLLADALKDGSARTIPSSDFNHPDAS